MAIAQQPTQPQMLGLEPQMLAQLSPQTSGLTQVHIKGPGDDGSEGSLGDSLDNGLDGSLDDSLDDLIRRHTAQRPDDVRKVIVGGRTTLQKVLKKFYSSLKKDYYNIPDFRKYINKTLTDVLTPGEITSLFQIIACETEDKRGCINGFHVIVYKKGDETRYITRVDFKISMFITTLIQLNYNAGYNDFEIISDSQHEMDLCGSRLNGTKERLMKVKIQGDVSIHGINSSYCEIDVNGDWDNTCSGNGKESEYCVFTFRGKVRPAPNLFNTEYCIIKTPNKENLGILVNYITHGFCNQVVFIRPDGEEEVVLQQTIDSETCVVNINKRYYDLVKDKFSEDKLQEAFGENKFLDDCGRKKVWKQYKVNVS